MGRVLRLHSTPELETFRHLPLFSRRQLGWMGSFGLKAGPKSFCSSPIASRLPIRQERGRAFPTGDLPHSVIESHSTSQWLRVCAGR